MCLCRSSPLYRKEMNIFIFYLFDLLYLVFLYACVNFIEKLKYTRSLPSLSYKSKVHNMTSIFLKKYFLQVYEGLKNRQAKQPKLKVYMPIKGIK